MGHVQLLLLEGLLLKVLAGKRVTGCEARLALLADVALFVPERENLGVLLHGLAVVGRRQVAGAAEDHRIGLRGVAEASHVVRDDLVVGVERRELVGAVAFLAEGGHFAVDGRVVAGHRRLGWGDALLDDAGELVLAIRQAVFDNRRRLESTAERAQMVVVEFFETLGRRLVDHVVYVFESVRSVRVVADHRLRREVRFRKAGRIV